MYQKFYVTIAIYSNRMNEIVKCLQSEQSRQSGLFVWLIPKRHNNEYQAEYTRMRMMRAGVYACFINVFVCLYIRVATPMGGEMIACPRSFGVLFVCLNTSNHFQMNLLANSFRGSNHTEINSIEKTN